MKLVKLTSPDGASVSVNPDAVATVGIPLKGENGKTNIALASGQTQRVNEEIDVVVSTLTAG